VSIFGVWKKTAAVSGSVLVGAWAFAQATPAVGADPAAASAWLTTLVVVVTAGVAVIAILVALATRKPPPAE
jgi:hypothetical protein